MTSKEILQKLKLEIFQPEVDYYEIQKMLNYIQLIEMDLEVLEIIKSHYVDLEIIGMIDNYKDYVETTKTVVRNENFILTETEWKKVKEWLEDE